jgi:hypothetical protein
MVRELKEINRRVRLCHHYTVTVVYFERKMATEITDQESRTDLLYSVFGAFCYKSEGSGFETE